MSFPLLKWILFLGIIGLSTALHMQMNQNSLPRSLQPFTSPLKIPQIYLYNTLSREKEVFSPLQSPKVTFYSCGPTVYDFAHIGNFRAFLTYDILKRWLQYCGYNLTDIDDKIILKMSAEGKSLKEITEKYGNAFFEDLKVLNILPANKYPLATEHVKDIEDMIKSLIDKGFAYQEKGSVYFRVEAFKDYGRLANIDFSQIQQGAGGFGPNERRGGDDKESFRDFALWKASEPQDSPEVVWDSQFGKGRPGLFGNALCFILSFNIRHVSLLVFALLPVLQLRWHIECSAMCNRFLGPTIDIHAGGVDLVFPHHQNEIAQSEAFSGQQYSRYWIHNGFVNIDNVKMSKSLKNFKTLRDIAQSPFDARAFRFMVVSAQYRAPLNFSPDTFEAASRSLRRIDVLINKLETIIASDTSTATASSQSQEPSGSNTGLKSQVEALVVNFETAMADDLAAPRAVASLFGLVSLAEKALKTNDVKVSVEDARMIMSAIKTMDTVFGVIYDVPQAYFPDLLNSVLLSDSDVVVEIPEQIVALAQERKDMKANKRFAEADALRARILGLGYEVVDAKDGFQIRACKKVS
eukprot:gene1225-2380_t